MSKYRLFWICCWAVVAPGVAGVWGCNGHKGANDGADAGADAHAGADADTDADADAGADADSDVDADAGTGTPCTSAVYRQCGAGGDVSWFDSCDVEGQVAEDCLPCATCANTSLTTAACQANTVEAYKQCGIDGKVHWYDSCDAEGAVFQICPACKHCDEPDAAIAVCDVDAVQAYKQCGRDGGVSWFDSCRVEGDLVEMCDSGPCTNQNETAAACVAIADKWTTIPAGSFWMGSPDGNCPAGYPGGSGTSCTSEVGRYASRETLHYVTLTHRFEIMRTEVTQGDFQTVMGWNPSTINCGYGCSAANPVYYVTWFDTLAYANRLSADAGLTPCYALTGVTCQAGFSAAVGTAYMDCYDGATDTGSYGGIASAAVALSGDAGTPYDCAGYRLPTESEWEYAIRAGSITAFYPSDGNDGTITSTENDPNMDQIGWYYYNSDTGGGRMTHAAGGKEPNAWGLYDMSGNVWEWAWDYYSASYPAGTPASPAVDPTGPGSGPERVDRAGSWGNEADGCRSAFRYGITPDQSSIYLGFRLARSVP